MPIDLSTTYLGMTLDNPLVVAACPLTANLDSLKRLRQAGAAAAVLPSLFEEQIEHDEMELARLFDFWTMSSPESSDYFPELDAYNTGPGEYLDLIADAKRTVNMPIIASLNGVTLGGWIRYAGLIERAGADALELNIYHLPTSANMQSQQVEQQLVELVQILTRELSIPLAVKLGPQFSSLPHLAQALEKAGARGLVLFNRYMPPDIDLETLRFVPALELSHPAELRETLRWIAILRPQFHASLAATGGVHSAHDVIKAMLVGADVVACASLLLQRGPAALVGLHTGLEEWLQEHEYRSLQQLQGSMSREHSANPEQLLRVHYMRALTSYTPH